MVNVNLQQQSIFPYTIFLDKLFERYNVQMPSADWKWSEMIDLMREMTKPEDAILAITTSPCSSQCTHCDT